LYGELVGGFWVVPQLGEASPNFAGQIAAKLARGGVLAFVTLRATFFASKGC
jgi:hypothetical protein